MKIEEIILATFFIIFPLHHLLNKSTAQFNAIIILFSFKRELMNGA